jgi:hypothetical protein
MSASATAPFIFNWNPPRRRSLVLAGFVLLSLGIHVAAFYVFQIVYPQTVSLLPTPRRVSLMTASSEQTATLLRWIDAEDPALASTTRKPAFMRREMGKVEHVPSYFAREAALKEPPPLTVDLAIPSTQPPGPVPMARPAAVPSAGMQPTQLTFSTELQQLGAAQFVPANFKTSSKETPQNAQFRIAVDPKGAVVYCFPLASSGDAVLDELAREHLALTRFAARPADSETLVWGIATIEWGNDVAATSIKPTPSAP